MCITTREVTQISEQQLKKPVANKSVPRTAKKATIPLSGLDGNTRDSGSHSWLSSSQLQLVWALACIKLSSTIVARKNQHRKLQISV